MLSDTSQWLSICICHIRLHRAMKRQGRSTSELEWKSPTGIWGSYLAAFIIVCCMVSLVVSAALLPVIPTSRPHVESALQNTIGFIVVFMCWVGHLLIAARRTNVSWRERFLIPLDQLALPELDVPVAQQGQAVGKRESEASQV